MPRGSKKKKRLSLFLLILVLAVVLRLVAIDKTPPALNWDEVSHGYNAYSILKTGRDEWGKSFPLIFRAYGDYKLPVYIYTTAVFEFFFGLTAFAVRLPSVLAGISIVVFTYLLAKELFDKRVALLASLLVAVEPWSLFLSRGAFEANLALAFIVVGVYFFIKGLPNPGYLLLATIFFGLSVWTYNSARIFTPLLLIALCLIYKKELGEIVKKNSSVIRNSLFIILLFFLPMFYQLANPVGQARYEWVAILDEGAIAQINEARSNADLPPAVSRLFYNKATYFVNRFVTNYLSHFSPEFLFLEGGSHYQFSVPKRGLLYLINLPFFVIGLILLTRKRKKKSFLILSWFFLAPLASSLTREAPHVLRSIVILPVPMIMSAFGLVSFSAWLKPRLHTTYYILLTSYLIILAGFVENYLSTYFTKYRTDYSWAWQYGYKEVVDYTKKHYEKYDKIIVTKKYGEPHEFFLFYWPWDPQDYRNDTNLIRFYQTNWYWVDGFDKFYFVNDWEIPKEAGRPFILESRKEEISCLPTANRCLLITSPGNYPKGWKKIKEINFLDNTAAFELYDNVSVSM